MQAGVLVLAVTRMCHMSTLHQLIIGMQRMTVLLILTCMNKVTMGNGIKCQMTGL